MSQPNERTLVGTQSNRGMLHSTDALLKGQGWAYHNVRPAEYKGRVNSSGLNAFLES